MCSSTFRDQVVEPLLADVQHEWQRATGFVQRAVILGRGYGAFWRAFGSHALRSWGQEVLGLSWRDVRGFPGVLAIVVVSLSLSHAWVTTGSVMNARFDQINTRSLWLMLPVFLLQRWIRIESGMRAIAIHAAVFAGFTVVLDQLVVLRPLMQGGTAFAVFCVVMVLVQRSRPEGRHNEDQPPAGG